MYLSICLESYFFLYIITKLTLSLSSHPTSQIKNNVFCTELQPNKPETLEEREGPVGQTATHEPHVWTPIDHFNPQYMEAIAARQQRVNFIKENKVPLYRVILNANKLYWHFWIRISFTNFNYYLVNFLGLSVNEIYW